MLSFAIEVVTLSPFGVSWKRVVESSQSDSLIHARLQRTLFSVCLLNYLPHAIANVSTHRNSQPQKSIQSHRMQQSIAVSENSHDDVTLLSRCLQLK
jgi:hypothetical protein